MPHCTIYFGNDRKNDHCYFYTPFNLQLYQNILKLFILIIYNTSKLCYDNDFSKEQNWSDKLYF